MNHWVENLNNIVAAFRGMHVLPAKHSYAWLPRKCDYRTDTPMDRQTPDKVIPMCRYASQATKINWIDTELKIYLLPHSMRFQIHNLLFFVFSIQTYDRFSSTILVPKISLMDQEHNIFVLFWFRKCIWIASSNVRPHNMTSSECYNIPIHKKQLKTVRLNCKANSKFLMQRLTKILIV